MHTLDGTFMPLVEGDEMRWLGLDDARALLTGEHDHRLLEMMRIQSMQFSGREVRRTFRPRLRLGRP